MQGTEQIEIRNIAFNDVTPKTVTLTLKNTGTSAVTIQEVWVNNAQVQDANLNPTPPVPIAANTQTQLTITMTYIAGDNYQFKVVTAKGNPFMKNAVPPS